MYKINKNSKIYIAGHKGMVGSAIWKYLKLNGFKNLIGRKRKELNLKNENIVFEFFEKEKPDIVIDAAAKVGGILANNDCPYQFLLENMKIQNNLIESSLVHDVKKFLFLGSSCIYPRLAKQPLKEEYLLTSSLEPTNQWYAIAKISGLKLCQAIRKQFNKNFHSLMPTNMYGYNDNFDLNSSHVLPALIRKFHDAKINRNMDVILWGTGKPLREFLFVDDLAEAVLFCLENNLDEDFYNIGSGNEISIKDLALLIQSIVGHKGKIKWDSNKPDGTPRKLLDVNKINKLGWKSKTDLKNGISKTYSWFLDNQNNFKEIKLNHIKL